MILILLIPLLVLLIDGFVAHWVVKKYVVFSTTTTHPKLWKFFIALLVFAVLAVVSIYLIAINFRFER